MNAPRFRAPASVVSTASSLLLASLAAASCAPTSGSDVADDSASTGSGSTTSAGGTGDVGSGGGMTSSGSTTSAGGTGSGGDSTASGAAPSTGGVSASGGSGSSTSGCDKPGVVFCEDFEAQTPGAFPGAPWVSTKTGDGGSIVVDAQTPAHSGTHSAKVDSNGAYQIFMSLTGAPVFPHQALYVRTFMRLSEPMTDGHNTYFKAGAAGASSSNNETRVGVMMSMLMINQPDGDRGFLSNQNYWTDKLPGAVIEKETWTCVEAFFDPPNSTVSVAMGGTDIPDLHRTDWKQDALGTLHFGFEGYAGPSTVLWYDDVVVSTQPIGCE